MKSILAFGLLVLVLVNVALSWNKTQDCKCRIQSKKRIVGGKNFSFIKLLWKPINLYEILKFSEAVQPACLPVEGQNHYDGILKVKYGC